MVGAIARHPGITAFTAGSVVLGTANTAAPDNKFVKAATLGSVLAGTGLFLSGGPNATFAGAGLVGAAVAGFVIGRVIE